MKITETQAKTILTPSKLPGADFVVNPYSGCAFGCVYCYADFTRRFTNHLDDKWGEYVDVKINASELFEKEIENLLKKIKSGKTKKFKGGKYPVLLFSSVTDPYQGVESKYKLTRKCLKILVDSSFKGEVSILTKSPLIKRDIDILQKLETVSVGLTITTTDDNVSRQFEKNAPPASLRFETLKALNEAGIETYAFVGPLIPSFATKRSVIEDLFKKISETGTQEIWIEHLNLSGPKWDRLLSELRGKITGEELTLLKRSQTNEYKEKLEKMIYSILENLPLKVVGRGVIDHTKNGSG